MMTVTETHMTTIRRQAYNDTAREMQALGVTLTHEQADEIGDEGMAYLRDRLGLRIQTDDRGMVATPVGRYADFVRHETQSPNGTRIVFV